MNSDRNILLVISTTRESPRTIDYALRRAQELKGKLVALCVIDTALPNSIVEKLADSGFVGDKPGEEVYAEIMEEYEQRGEKKLAEIVEAARKNVIPAKGVLKKGDLIEECLKAAQEEKAAVVIVGRKKMSKLSRFIFGSPIQKIEENCRCPVEVIEEN